LQAAEELQVILDQLHLQVQAQVAQAVAEEDSILQ
jgi:hypothetical protein